MKPHIHIDIVRDKFNGHYGIIVGDDSGCGTRVLGMKGVWNTVHSFAVSPDDARYMASCISREADSADAIANRLSLKDSESVKESNGQE